MKAEYDDIHNSTKLQHFVFKTFLHVRSLCLHLLLLTMKLTMIHNGLNEHHSPLALEKGVSQNESS